MLYEFEKLKMEDLGNSSSRPPMALSCGIGILFLDQWSKLAIQLRPAGCARAPFRFVPHRQVSYERSGARFALVALWLLALFCGVVLAHSGTWFQTGTSRAGLGFAFGGAASNLLDILRRRYVVNVIDLGWWPAFNLADAAIVAGLAAAMFA
jgi:lipoprotein signal peptidase